MTRPLANFVTRPHRSPPRGITAAIHSLEGRRLRPDLQPGTDIRPFRESRFYCFRFGVDGCRPYPVTRLRLHSCIALLVPNNAFWMRLKETRICSVIARILKGLRSGVNNPGFPGAGIFPSARVHEAFHSPAVVPLKKNSGMTQEVCSPAVSNSTQLILIRHCLLPAPA